MEPQIRYARTSDGVNIAYTTYGEAGPPLLVPPNVTGTHLQLELDMPDMRGFFEGLSRKLRVIRYDCRGLGMSDRHPIDYSAEAAQRDLAAVVDALGLESFALFNHILAGDGPLAFVANNPGRVNALVYWIGQTIAISEETLRQHQVIEPLSKDEWGLFTNIVSRLLFGWDSPYATPYAAMLRAGSSSEARAPGLAASQRRGYELLERIKAPTMIAHITGADVPTRRARKVASALASAVVRSVPGDPKAMSPFAYDNEQLIAAIIEFVESHSSVEARGSASNAGPQGMSVIFFADIADSTALTERLGDAAFRAKARDLDTALRTTIQANGGTCIDAKTLGDGVLATFTSAAKAIEAALACARVGENAGLPMHLGLHAGDVIREDNNVFGGAVNVAARISGLSAPGEVLVSDTVRDLARTSANVGFEDTGTHELKGVSEPVRAWRVSTR